MILHFTSLLEENLKILHKIYIIIVRKCTIFILIQCELLFKDTLRSKIIFRLVVNGTMR